MMLSRGESLREREALEAIQRVTRHFTLRDRHAGCARSR
jgi:hypothetical protein